MNKSKHMGKNGIAEGTATQGSSQPQNITVHTQETRATEASVKGRGIFTENLTLLLTALLAGATVVTAYVAVSTLKMTERSFQIDQQPYVVRAETVLLPTDAAAASVTMMFKNMGKSPARNVRIFSSTAVRRRPVSGEDIEQMARTVNNIVATKSRPALQRERSLAPTDGFLFTLDLSSGVPPTDVLKVQSGEIMLFAMGDVTYDDMFGKQHVTEFCTYHLSPDPKMWNLCTIHNDIR